MRGRARRRAAQAAGRLRVWSPAALLRVTVGLRGLDSDSGPLSTATWHHAIHKQCAEHAHDVTKSISRHVIHRLIYCLRAAGHSKDALAHGKQAADSKRKEMPRSSEKSRVRGWADRDLCLTARHTSRRHPRRSRRRSRAARACSLARRPSASGKATCASSSRTPP